MEDTAATPGGLRTVQHGTLHDLCEQLRRLAPRVVPPVHRFDLAPQVMQGLFAVALVTREGELHRTLVSYRDAAALAPERERLAQLLLWAELTQTDGRMEIGANTGSLLRYFLPNSAEQGAQHARRQAERSHADWLATAEALPGPRVLWHVRVEDGGALAGITAAGVHCLLRLATDDQPRLEAARRRLGCRIVGQMPAHTPLGRDALGEWRR